MFKVGLTGGIGCGKTTVSKLFAELDVPIIDADEIAHRLVEPGQQAILEICKTFGDQALNPDGSLNRPYLRDIIFSDSDKKQTLENILHPLVFTAMNNAMNELNKPYCIVSIPLLFETQRTDFVDRVLVIDCPVTTQIDRVQRRDNLTDVRIRSIINSQVSRSFRLAHADDIIDNSGTGDRLAEQVKKLHNQYLSLSISAS